MINKVPSTMYNYLTGNVSRFQSIHESYSESFPSGTVCNGYDIQLCFMSQFCVIPELHFLM